jgi:hypothetical protein
MKPRTWIVVAAIAVGLFGAAFYVSFAALQGYSKLPAFMWETLSGNAVLGMKFIDAIQPRGWPEVEKLYRERPPASTEQILHPGKAAMTDRLLDLRSSWTVCIGRVPSPRTELGDNVQRSRPCRGH